jgi:hypothetical protein
MDQWEFTLHIKSLQKITLQLILPRIINLTQMHHDIVIFFEENMCHRWSG